MAREPRTAAPLRPRDTAAYNDRVGPLPRQYDSTDGARPENGMHPRREYILLTPEDLEGGQSNAGPRARGGGHRATRRMAEEGRMETPTGDRTGQRALLSRGMQDDGEEAHIPLNRLRVLNVCGHPGREGGGETLT